MIGYLNNVAESIIIIFDPVAVFVFKYNAVFAVVVSVFSAAVIRENDTGNSAQAVIFFFAQVAIGIGDAGNSPHAVISILTGSSPGSGAF